MNENLKIQIEESLHSPNEGQMFDLSQEIMSVIDYKWLAEIIKKSSVVETILLPPIPNKIAEDVISILNKATINNSTLINMDINIDHNNEQCSEYVVTMQQQITSRMLRNKKKIFAIHGGGNIGLGLMAYIVSKSPFHYNIVATSNNSLIYNLVNSTNKLWLQHDLSNPNDATCVTNVTMVSREKQDVINLYHEAALIAICVTSAVLPMMAKDIAQALINRFRSDGSGLKILILMNLPNCDTFVRDKVYDEIVLITKDELEAKEIISGIEFIPTVIDRIVIPIPEEKIKLQLKKQLVKIDKEVLHVQLGEDNIDHIISSSDKLKKAISVFDLQFNLFNAEKSFSMYVHDHFIEAHRFPLVEITNDLAMIEAVKNKYINGPHAVLAWIGALLGFDTIAESINHPALYKFIKEMMKDEIGPILCAEYPELSASALRKLESTFFDRCRVSTEDTVTRVARDPMRKLNSGERVRGVIELAQKHNLRISTARLELGLAAGFLYAVKFDPANPGCQKIRKIYKDNNNSFYSVLCYSGQAPGGTFTGLTPNKDKMLIGNILSQIKYFNCLCESLTIKKQRSSTALAITKKHVALSTNEQRIEHPSPQLAVAVTTNNSSIYHNYHKNKFLVLYSLRNKSGSSHQNENRLKISNG